MLKKLLTLLLTLSIVICSGIFAVSADKKPVYLTELTPVDRYGKLYYHTFEPLTVETNSNPMDIDSYGWVQPEDNRGNTYTWGLHLDGPYEEDYWVKYDLGFRYDTLELTVACSSVAVGSANSEPYVKSVTVWLDEESLTLPVMSTSSRPKTIRINVESVRFLKLEWIYSPGANDLSVIYDPILY